MSRFFDESRTSGKATEGVLPDSRLDLEQLVSAVKQGVQQGVENASLTKGLDKVPSLHIPADISHEGLGIADFWLQHCQKIPLAHSSEIFIYRNESPAAQLALEEYRALRTRLIKLQASNNIRSVAVSSAMPNEGKTSVALNLALCCAQLYPGKILLVDADMRTQGLTHTLNLPSTPGLADVLIGHAQYQDAVLLLEHANLHVMGSGEMSVAPPELYAGSGWEEFLAWANDYFKMVLIDCPPVLPLTDVELITAACDGLLLVVRALATQRELLQKAVSHLDSDKLLGWVFNDVEGSPHNAYSHYTYMKRSEGASSNTTT